MTKTSVLRQSMPTTEHTLRSTYWNTVLDSSPSSSSCEQGLDQDFDHVPSTTSSWTSNSSGATLPVAETPTAISSSQNSFTSDQYQHHMYIGQQAPPLPPSPTLTRFALSSSDPTCKDSLDRPHPCPLCPARFRQRSHLTAHYRVVHYKCKPFVCSYCNHSFGKKYDLKMHVAAVHFRLRAFQCDHCSKSFAKKSNLSRHRSHRHPTSPKKSQ